MPRGPARALLAVIAARARDGVRRAGQGLNRKRLSATLIGKRGDVGSAVPAGHNGAWFLREVRPMQLIEANGANIPAIGLGTWELRGRTCARLVEQAIRLGYRHIDTAQVYENEREVGEGLRASANPARPGVRHDQGLDHPFRAERSRTLHQGEPDQTAAHRSRSVAAALAKSAGAAARRRWVRWRMSGNSAWRGTSASRTSPWP